MFKKVFVAIISFVLLSMSAFSVNAAVDTSDPFNGKHTCPHGYAVFDRYIVPTQEGWGWAQIIINTSAMATFPSDIIRKGVIMHEIGHTFGLCHNWNTGSIMCSLVDGRTVDTPQNYDCNNVNHLYPLT